MGKMLFILLLIGVILFVVFRAKEGPEQTLDSPTPETDVGYESSIEPTQAVEGYQGGNVGVSDDTRSKVERACTENQAELLFYQKHPGGIVEIQIKASSLSSIQQALQGILMTGIMLDFYDKEAKYQQANENGRIIHVAYYKFSVR